ncbi:MlaD family protein [Nocardia callitridis]|uniref:MCE family protein n=1 Tax=Nocardia callitridis TaxID=648753 RepID=A0ABP9KIZ7_9NOCA
MPENSGGVRRFVGSRGFMSTVGVLALGAVVAVGYVTVLDPPKDTASYCALMPDSIGLYAGNHVTIRGIQVGTVSSVRPENGQVRVDFTVDADYPMHADAAATTLSRTIVADRELAVLDTGPQGTRWDAAQCITKTATPKSMTETFDALGKLADEILGADTDAQRPLGRAVSGLDAATAGTGPELNELMHKVAIGLHDPDAAIAHLAGAVGTLSDVSNGVAGHWGDIKEMLTRLAPVLDQANHELFTETVELLNGFQKALPMINDVTTMFGGPILNLLDLMLPVTQFLGDHVGILVDIINLIPPLLEAIRQLVNPDPNAPGLVYAPPKVALPAAQATQVCSALTVVAPGYCANGPDGLPNINLVQLVLGMARTR